MKYLKKWLVFAALIYQSHTAAATTEAYFEITDELLRCDSGNLTLAISAAILVTKYKHDYLTAVLPSQINCTSYKTLIVDGLAPGRDLPYSLKQGALHHCIPHDFCEIKGFYENVEVLIGGIKFTSQKNVQAFERYSANYPGIAADEDNDEFTGTQCGPANRKTGIRVCCHYVKGVKKSCGSRDG